MGLIRRILTAILDESVKAEKFEKKINFKQGFRRIVIVLIVLSALCSILATLLSQNWQALLIIIPCAFLAYFAYLVVEFVLCWMFRGFFMTNEEAEQKKVTFKSYLRWVKLQRIRYERKKRIKAKLSESKQNEYYNNPIIRIFFDIFDLWFVIKTEQDLIDKKEKVMSYYLTHLVYATVIEFSVVWFNCPILWGVTGLIYLWLMYFWHKKTMSIIPCLLTYPLLIAGVFYYIGVYEKIQRFSVPITLEFIQIFIFAIIMFHGICINRTNRKVLKEKNPWLCI